MEKREERTEIVETAEETLRDRKEYAVGDG